MRSRRNWYHLILFLVLVSIFLVACERPLPGGYNDPYAGSDTTESDVPISVPEVEPEAYPADVTAPEGTAPEDAAYPAEEATVEQGVTAGEEPPADTGEAQPEAESPATEAPVDATPVPEEAPAEGAATEGEAAAEESATDVPGTHTVAEGENLYRIGLLYGVNWLDLAAANDIVDPANLTVGQVLVIPTPAPEVSEEAETAAEEPAATEAPAETEPAETEPAETEPAETETAETVELPTTYIVQQGDNLFRIGVNFGVLWTDIVAANGIVDNQIYPGQELIIPAPADSETAAEAATDEAPETPEAPAAEAETVAGTEYIVEEGDTIFSVAFRNSIPWTSLVEANDLQAPYTLEIGQTLIIPVSD